MEELTNYYRTEVDRIQTLLKAERTENVRLRAACAHYKGAAEAGYSALQLAKIKVDEDGEGLSGFGEVIDQMAGSIDEGDDLMLPTAAEVKP